MDEKKPFVTINEDIQAKLDKKLGPEYISKRVGFGTSRVAYIEGWRVINLANQIFGYNGWSTEVKNVTIDFLDEKQGKFCIGCTAIVRVTLDNGTHREDIGYGTVENERRKAAAFERAKKSAVTDALKRSLRGFGNALGNCLYDKDFLSKIDKVKFDPPDFDEGNLFRPSDEISENSRANTMDVPDSVSNKRRQLAKVGTNTNNNNNINFQGTKVVRNTNSVHEQRHSSEPLQKGIATEDPVTKQDPDDLLDDSLMFSDDFQDDDLINIGAPGLAPHSVSIPKPATLAASNEPATFVTAKAATTLQNKSQVQEENVFDPKYQAQSIKHTIDQTTSKPVPMTVLKEKGLPSSKDSVYEKFAPKGKQLDSVNNGNQPEDGLNVPTNPPQQPVAVVAASTNSIAGAVAASSGSRFAPPSEVVHPNSHMTQNNTKLAYEERNRET